MTKDYTNTREPGEFGDGVTVELEPNAIEQAMTDAELIRELEAFSAYSDDLYQRAADRLESLTQPPGKVSDERVERAARSMWFDIHHDWESARNAPESSHLGYRVAHTRKQARIALEAAQLPARPVVTVDDDLHELYLDALAEAEKAMRKYPQPNYVISKVAEEAGEVVKAAIHCAEGRETHTALVGEIKQALAMLLRLYIEGDQVHGLTPPRAALGGQSNG